MAIYPNLATLYLCLMFVYLLTGQEIDKLLFTKVNYILDFFKKISNEINNIEIIVGNSQVSEFCHYFES